MEIRFNEERWDALERNWERFWAGELERSLVWVEHTAEARNPIGRKRQFFPQYPAEMSAEEMIEIEHAHLAGKRFIGDTFPKMMVNFGAGSMASYLGASVHADESTVWFEPTEGDTDGTATVGTATGVIAGPSSGGLAGIRTEVDPDSYWYRRVRSVFAAATRRWPDGLVQIAHTGINGNMDIIASLRGSEQLLMDLLDDPLAVDDVTRRITQSWIDVHREEAREIRSVCRGTSHHAPIWANGTAYLLQSDFSYMISPAMFERFVLPDIETLSKYLSHPIYHLDGKGQIPHLEMLLSIDELRMIQWVPGAGQPGPSKWLPLLKRIRDAGKRVQVWDTPEGALEIVRELGGRGFAFGILGDTLSESEKSDLFHTIIRS